MNLSSFFFPWLDSLRGPKPPLRGSDFTLRHTHTHTHTLGRLFWTSDRPVVITHSQETDIHVPGGSRTSNPSKQAAVYPRLRQRGHWIGAFWTRLKLHPAFVYWTAWCMMAEQPREDVWWKRRFVWCIQPTGYDYNNCHFEDKGHGISVLKHDHGTNTRTNR